MRLVDRIAASCRIVLDSLRSPLSACTPNRSGAQHDAAGQLSATTGIFPAILNDPGCFSEDGRTVFVIPHVLPLTAPFILYRLKRQGLSECRVVTTATGGMRVEARR